MLIPDPIEKKLIKTLRSAVKDLHAAALKGNTPWTKKIKQYLRDLGFDNNCDVCTAGFPGVFERGWLYDLVWYKEDKRGFLLDVPLVVESEWLQAFKHIKFDFEKLLTARATHRLMICQCKARYKDDRLKYFREAVKLYQSRQKGDRYLIAMLDYDEESFHFELIVLTSLNIIKSITLS